MNRTNSFPPQALGQCLSKAVTHRRVNIGIIFELAEESIGLIAEKYIRPDLKGHVITRLIVKGQYSNLQ